MENYVSIGVIRLVGIHAPNNANECIEFWSSLHQVFSGSHWGHVCLLMGELNISVGASHCASCFSLTHSWGTVSRHQLALGELDI